MTKSSNPRVKPPFPWLGGKTMMISKLLPLFPECRTYVDAFGGGGSLLLAKEPSPVEVYNDLDGDLVNLFRVLRDSDGAFPDFYHRACLSPYSREEYDFCRRHLNDDPDPVERARRFFVVARFSFSGAFGSSFGLNVTSSTRGMVEKAFAYRSALCMLPLISERLLRVEIENRDFRPLFSVYDTEHTFWYLDPPYLPETRKGGKYRCEMTIEDHQDLVDILRSVKGKVMLSGYPNALYDQLGWKRLEWETTCRAAGRTRASGLQGEGKVKEQQKRTECVWMNY